MCFASSCRHYHTRISISKSYLLTTPMHPSYQRNTPSKLVQKESNKQTKYETISACSNHIIRNLGEHPASNQTKAQAARPARLDVALPNLGSPRRLGSISMAPTNNRPLRLLGHCQAQSTINHIIVEKKAHIGYIIAEEFRSGTVAERAMRRK